MLKTNPTMNPSAVVGNPAPLHIPPGARVMHEAIYPGGPMASPYSIPPGPPAMAIPNGGLPPQQYRPVDMAGPPASPMPAAPLEQPPQPPQSLPLPLGSQEEEADQQQQQQTLANIKEKTPMCLINELARYNKILHQYTLINEQGPAHKKTFYVKLKLGEEEYNASGPSIKKAQHAAASSALTTTSFKHPPPKPPKSPDLDSNSGSTVTPTVELNALAMKRNEPAIYKSIENRQPSYYHPASFDYRALGYNQSVVDPGGKAQVPPVWYHYPRMPRTFYVSLKVGTREFIGEGATRQAARHNAASKALRILKTLPMPEETVKKEEVEEEEEDEKDKLKSEISLVHEIALKRNLPVNFEVVREAGPPHMKMFSTQCIVGDLMTEAEGNSKKVSKKKAAEMMLDELRKLPTLSTVVQRPKTKQPVNKKKNRNLIKVQKADPNYGVGINPISRLIQIMQAQKKKEPVYSFQFERGLPRRREFVIQVQVDENVCTGTGPNKKLAKRNAAEAMLQLLGYSKPAPQPTKSAIKTTSNPDGGSGDKKVTFLDNSTENGSMSGGAASNSSKAGRQLVPGLLLLDNKASPPPLPTQKDTSNSKTNPSMEQVLQELAKNHGIEVLFEDFIGQNSSHLCQVVLRMTPVQTKHGRGKTSREARNAAAAEALHFLAELDIHPSPPETVSAGGDSKLSDGPEAGGAVKTESKVE